MIMKKIIILNTITCVVLFSSCIKPKEDDEIRPKEKLHLDINEDTYTNLSPYYDLELDVSTGNSSSTYDWKLNATHFSDQAIIIISKEGNYSVDIATAGDTIHYTVYIVEGFGTYFFYPNSFTPGENGYNQSWGPIGTIDHMLDFEFKVFNDDNVLMFTTNQCSEAWDGKYNEMLCSPGIYYYVVRYTTYNGERHCDAGMFQLLSTNC